MALCHVTGTVYLPDGSVAARREVSFYKLPDNVTADYLGAVVPEPIATRTDNDGAIDVNLITGNYHGYTLDRNGKNRYQFKAVVPESTTADFSDLIDAVAPAEPLPAWLQQAIEARDEARAAVAEAEGWADAAEGEADRAESAAADAVNNAPWNVRDYEAFTSLPSLVIGARYRAPDMAWDALATGSPNYDFIHPSGVPVRVVRDSHTLNVKAFGAVGDGVADDTAAIAAAHATGSLIFYPYGTYKHVGHFPQSEGGIIGEGWSWGGSAKQTQIVFYNCTDTTKAAIDPKRSSPKSQFYRIENIKISASSWDITTGCLGYGLIIATPVRITNVCVEKFKKSNMFVFAGDTSGVAVPYLSVIENLVSLRSGEHGVLMGNGANAVTFINPTLYWNGCTEFGVSPTVAGNFDGFQIATTSDGVPGIPTYWPEGLTVIGGDSSYNSRYGWNFSAVRNSSCIKPAYAEFNLVKEARCGSAITRCDIAFGKLHLGEAGFLNEMDYTPYDYSRTVYLGTKVLHPVDDFGLIANPTLPDEAGGAVVNAPKRRMFLSRDNSISRSTYIGANYTPDGTLVDVASETVATIRGFGTGAWIGLGSGGRHVKIGNDTVILPDLYHQKTAQGWNAPYLRRGMTTGSPTGAGTQGDIMYERNPSPGGFIGYVCTETGTPGTWKGFGAIEA